MKSKRKLESLKTEVFEVKFNYIQGGWQFSTSSKCVWGTSDCGTAIDVHQKDIKSAD